MPRRLRPPQPDGVFHLTANAVDGSLFVWDDVDRARWVWWLERVVRLRRWCVYAWCLMNTHYHLLAGTPDGNLSDGMQELNCGYAREFNRRHGRRGHLLRRRFHDTPVRKESHLLEAVRYIAMNPVTAGVVDEPDEWIWSSHRGEMGLTTPIVPTCALELFGPGEADDVRRRYAEFVAARG